MKPIHVGLVADPASPTKIARRMSNLDPPGGADRDAWDIEVVSEPFTTGSEDVDSPRGQAAAASHESDGPTAGHHVVTADEVRSMTDAELCQAWRRSFVRLMSTDNLGRRAGVVSLRQAILDELEVRHPAGLRAWLDSGARPAGGPDRFLGRSDEVGPRKPPGRAPGTASPPD